MRIVFFGNGWVGLHVLEWLKAQGEQIVGLVVEERERQLYGPEIIAASGLAEDSVLSPSDLRTEEGPEALRRLRPDIGLSAMFSHILKADVLALFPRGVLNVHPGYLPYNRGRSAQVWAIVDHTPVGATMHYMDVGVDTGPIVERLEVPIDITDTGGSLRQKMERACLAVVKTAWPMLAEGREQLAVQDPSAGTSHRLRDLETISRIELDRQYTGGELIDLLRALTSPPRSPGAYFERDGRRIRIAVQLWEEGSGDK